MARHRGDTQGVFGSSTSPKFALPPELIHRWADLIAMRTIMIDSPASGPNLVRDPNDLAFLSAAIVANAEFLITGDQDLLSATTTVATRIISVADFAAFANLM